METDLLKEELLSYEIPLKVLLLLSGGKDSVCCLYKLVGMNLSNLYIETLFMNHKWVASLSREEAKRHSSTCGVKYNEIDYTDALQKKLATFSYGRPCLVCKRMMYEFSIEFAIHNGFNMIATGDSKSDVTTVARLAVFNANLREKRFFCSRYLAGEQGLILPESLSVVRPLLDKSSNEIEEELKNRQIEVKRNYSTGDKYFDYSREGCSLQFCDPGTEISREIADKLYLYNKIANDWGQKHKVRTSVHIPSTFIVTIPAGYEKQVADELRSHGLFVSDERNTSCTQSRYLSVVIENYPDVTYSSQIFNFLLRRFSERLSLRVRGDTNSNLFFSENENFSLNGFFSQKTLILNIKCKKSYEESLLIRIYHLCIEVFHSRAISINGKTIEDGNISL